MSETQDKKNTQDKENITFFNYINKWIRNNKFNPKFRKYNEFIQMNENLTKEQIKAFLKSIGWYLNKNENYHDNLVKYPDLLSNLTYMIDGNFIDNYKILVKKFDLINKNDNELTQQDLKEINKFIVVNEDDEQNENDEKIEINNFNFSNNKMSQEIKKQTLKEIFGHKEKKAAKDLTDFYNSLNGKFESNIYPLTKIPNDIRYNSKYMRPDYFYNVLSKQKGKDKWSRQVEDLDNDGVKDIGIYDDKNRLRYFNGYYIKPGDENHNLQKFMTSEREDKYWGHDAYYHEYLGKKSKPKQPYTKEMKDMINLIMQALKLQLGSYNDKNVFEKGGLTRDKTHIVERLNLKSKLMSVLNKLVLAPIALLMTVPNLDPEDIKQEFLKEDSKNIVSLIATNKKNPELAKQFSETLKDIKYNKKANETMVKAFNTIGNQLFELAKKEPMDCINLILALNDPKNKTGQDLRMQIIDMAIEGANK